MAEQHDMFDDIIEISKGVDALKNPFGGITDALLGTVDESSRIGIPPITRSVRASTAFPAWPANPRRAAAMRAWTYAR